MHRSHAINHRILIAGCGQLGLPLARRLAASHEVWGLARSRREPEAGIHFIQADLCEPNSLGSLPDNIDTLVYCVSPGERSEEAYRTIYVDGLRHLVTVLGQNSELQQLIYVSSTSVYGQSEHEWVDEDSPTEANNFTGRIIREGELLAQSLCPKTCIIRFSGIYGGSRSRLIDMVKSGRATLKSRQHFSNRIHEEDCIGFMAHVLKRAFEGKTLLPCYLASDSQPSDQNDVLNMLANALDVSLKYGDTPIMREGVGSKRCRNTRMLETGYEFRYPSYVEGYAEMLGRNERISNCLPDRPNQPS